MLPIELTMYQNSAVIYLFKVKNRHPDTCIIGWKLTVKTPEWRQSRRSSAFIVNFEQISHIFLEFALLTLNSKCRVKNCFTDFMSSLCIRFLHGLCIIF